MPRWRYCGLSREVKTDPDVPFPRLWRRTIRTPRGALTIFQTVSKDLFSEVHLTWWGCQEEDALPGANSSQAAITKKVPNVRDPSGKAWSKVTKYAGSASNTRGQRGAPARQSATAAVTSATIQAYLPMSNRSVLKGSANRVSMASTAARSPSAPT